MDKVFLDAQREVNLIFSPIERAGEVEKDIKKISYSIHKALKNKYVVQKEIKYYTYVSPFTNDTYDFNFPFQGTYLQCIKFILKARKEVK